MASLITANYDSETDQIIDNSSRSNNGVPVGGVPVMAIPSGSGVVIPDARTVSAGGRALVRPNVGFVGVGDLCTASLSAAAEVTRMATRKNDVAFGALKGCIYNAHTVAFAGCKALAAIAPGGADPYGSTATFSPLLFSGSASFTLPPGSGVVATGTHRFGTIYSDILHLEGDVGQLLMGRVYINGANNPRFEHPTKSAGLVADGIVQSYFLGDGVTTPANYVPTYHTTGPSLHWILYPKSQCISWIVGGNSTAAGQGDTETLGWARRTEKLAEAAGVALAVKNMSHPGSTTTDSLARVLPEIAALKPTFASWPVASTNGAPALTDLPRLKYEIMSFIDACRQASTIPVLLTFQPSTAASGETLQVIQALNAFARSIARAGNCAMLDVHYLFAGSDAANAWLDAADHVDGTHPSAQGHAKLAEQAFKLVCGG